MSKEISSVGIDYPESDGQPMGETDWHIDAIIRLRDMLRRRYGGQRVYVGSDLLVYYVEGEPRRFVVPDVFVVMDCDSRDRSTFKIWEENQTPAVVFEITSRSTAREDQVFKPKIYEQIGVKEIFLFDPTGDYLAPRLQGIEFLNGVQAAMQLEDSQLHSEVLGVDITFQDSRLKLTDSKTGSEVMTGEEWERQAKEIECQARIAAEAKAERLQGELDQLRKKQQNL